MPLVSIITTTYKHQDFIAHTIESVLSQTFDDWELLIGDDSPDDATRDIIHSYVTKHPDKIKARHHSPNKGIVDNMNFLLGQTSQESQYIAFLEGDDMYMPTNVEEKMKIFKEYTDVGLVYSDLQTIDENNRVLDQSRYKGRLPYGQQGYNTPISPYHFVDLPHNIMSYSSCMIRKSILQGIPGIRSLGILHSSTSDRDFYNQIVTKYSFYHIDAPLLKYRWHANNFSKQHGIIGYHLYRIIQYYVSSGERSRFVAFSHLFRLQTLTNKHVFVWRIKIFLQLCLPSSVSHYLFAKIYKIT